VTAPGLLSVVGIGPGGRAHRTHAADEALGAANVVIGYGPYLDQCADALAAGQRVVRGEMGDEAGRAARAVDEARAGARVALVSSGDAGVYGMATLALEAAAALPEGDRPRIEVVPGVTAALAAAALLGSPLGHDFACLTLSDVRTPWADVERRLHALAAADVALALYNPRSRGRPWQLGRARDILAGHRPGGTPVGVVTDAGRAGQRVTLTTLAELDPALAGMTSLVLVGASTSRMAGPWLVAAR